MAMYIKAVLRHKTVPIGTAYLPRKNTKIMSNCLFSFPIPIAWAQNY